MELKSFIILSWLWVFACCEGPLEQLGRIEGRRGDCLDRLSGEHLGDGLPALPDSQPHFIPDSSDNNALVDSSGLAASDTLPDPVVYVCGVQFAGSPEQDIVVFKDGKLHKLFRYTDEVAGSDPDGYFLFEDRVYTVACNSISTTVSLDAVPLFSFSGREYITHMIERRDGLWTLGTMRSGDGFSLRKDGGIVISKTVGTPGRLYEDDGHLYFMYKAKLGGKTLYYLVTDGEDLALTPTDGWILLDALVCVGKLWTLEAKGRECCLRSEDGSGQKYSYTIPYGFELVSGELWGRGEDCSAVINLISPYGGMPAELHCDGEKLVLTGGGSASYHYYSTSAQHHLILTRDAGTLYVFGPNEYEEKIDAVGFGGQRCAMQYGSSIYLCCAPKDDSAPYVWKTGGLRMSLALDGIPVGIWVEPPD